MANSRPRHLELAPTCLDGAKGGHWPAVYSAAKPVQARIGMPELIDECRVHCATHAALVRADIANAC